MRELPGPARWVAVVALATVIEAVALRNQDKDATLSHFTRVVFQTDTPTGKVALVAAWAALTVWLIPHLINGTLTFEEPQ